MKKVLIIILIIYKLLYIKEIQEKTNAKVQKEILEKDKVINQYLLNEVRDII
jgi:hypothetical protein